MNGKIESLQGLRAFAAIAVLFVHAKFVFPGGISVGSLGVHVFFVISGFIMAYICATNPECFLRRRIARVAPPYWALTLLVFGLAYVAPSWFHGTTADPVHLLKSLLFIPYLKENGVIQPVLYVGWSLNWEMLFYFAVWLGLFVNQRYASMIGASVIAAFALVCTALHRPGDVLLTFYGDLAGYEFLLGALAFEVVTRTPTAVALRYRQALSFCVTASLAGLIIVEWTVRAENPMFVMLALLSFASVCSAALLSASGFDLKNKPLIAIGNASYIVYLIHPFCFSLYDSAVVTRFPWLTPRHPIGLILCIGLVVAVSRVLHTRAELPCYKWLRRLFERAPRGTDRAAPSVPLTFGERDATPRFWRQR